MIYLYTAILILLLTLWIVSKVWKLPIPEVNNGYSKPFLAPAVLIHFWVERLNSKIQIGGIRVKQMARNRQLSIRLHSLCPGEASDLQLYRYKVERTSLILLILSLGSALALLLSLVAMENGVLEGDLISRNEYGETDIIADLTAGVIKDENNTEGFDVEVIVQARKYSREELDDMFQSLSLEIDQLIVGENDSLNHVIGPISLPKRINGYPFDMTWECNNYELVDADGSVHNENLSEPEIVTFIGDCLYEHDHWYLIRTILVCPPEYTEHELIEKELLTQIEINNKKTSDKSELILPESISYGRVNWMERIDDDSALALIITVLVCVIIVPAKENEVNRKVKKRMGKLLIEYPSFVSKLTLYMGAGMSVRNCFLIMGREYDQSCKKRVKGNSRIDYLGMELSMTAHELEMGISETEVYEHLGKRIGSREYTRFVALLNQNLKKGSTDLIKMLTKESEEAFEIRKNEARRLGEEASTKLLIPMVMMLAVVMIIIMIPAYMSFSS